jgi:hypothetical protein
MFALIASAQIGIGETREDVLSQLGKPTSVARRGDREIFLYPKGGRIELIGGKVADVKGPLPEALAPPPVAVTAVPNQTTPAPEAVAPVSPVTDPDTAKAAQKASAKSASPDYSPAIAANELAKHVEKMDTPWGAAPPKQETHSVLDSIPSFLLGLVLRFGITILALKLAFKYWEMDAFWKGILAIAGIDLALHAAFELLGPLTGGFTTLTPVENGVPGLVLIYTINRFCFNKRLQNAVFTAAAVKTVVTMLYVFLALALLNSLFG